MKDADFLVGDMKTIKQIEKDRVVFTRAMITALQTGLPMEIEDMIVGEVVGGFTVSCPLGFFVVTVQKAG
jgi:hypothetical protein